MEGHHPRYATQPPPPTNRGNDSQDTHATHNHTIMYKQKYIGTLLSSHTTTAHPDTNHHVVTVQSDELKTYPTDPTEVKSTRSCFPSGPVFLPPAHTQPLTRSDCLRGVVGRADSHKVTHRPDTTQIPSSHPQTTLTDNTPKQALPHPQAVTRRISAPSDCSCSTNRG